MPGDVVVCVLERDLTVAHPCSLSAILVKDAVYNIREVMVATYRGKEAVGVTLAQEETRWFNKNGQDGCWHHTMFRRVYRPDGKFTSMLLQGIDSNVKVKA